MVVAKNFRLFAIAGLSAVALLLLIRPATAPMREQILTVHGSTAAVDRFVGLQQSRHPALHPINRGMDARIALPPGFTGAELVGLTREALAAGLSYSFEQRTQTALNGGA
jgi:hypothetical protein